MQRRDLLILPIGALGVGALSSAAEAETPKVGAGADRQGSQHTIGVSTTAYKVLTSETRGALFVMEHVNHKNGGPALHTHHGENELFYVLEGDYVVQVGAQTVALKPGDCALGPVGIPHAWAFVGQGQGRGRLLLSYAPAGKMEAFFNGREKAGVKPGAYADHTQSGAALMREFGMEVVGPPIDVSKFQPG